MLNQAAVEALYSANYIEDYLDYVENVPMEISRYVSRVRELDLTHIGLLKEIEQHTDTLLHEIENTSQKKLLLLTKMQQALIWAQEIGDEKLRVMQQVQDVIENKTRQLDLDYRSLADVGKETENFEIPKDASIRDTIASLPLNNGGSGGERQSKRVRRTRTDLAISNDPTPAIEPTLTPEPTKQPPQAPQQSMPTSSAVGTPLKKASVSMGKKKKRKNRQSSQKDSQSVRERDDRDSPQREDELVIDPDEPTYCLCEQISYGEMIMCDNDICPYEWFHFSCVSLGVKPKGKWYCPKCRGDRSSIMKPKAQLMKELDRLKVKDKETKEEKGS